MQILTPQNEAEVVDAIIGAAGEGRHLDLQGGGTRADIGAPDRQAGILSLRALSGIVDYDPAELVLTARAGTPLAELEQALAERNQCLAFEPWGDAGSTIGGIVAAGVSGSRRVSAGAARDYLLGFRAVSGRGESFVAGAKVVKNVTGYDLPKLMCGSWGRLAALTEVTLKVLPAAPESATLIWRGLDPADGWALMSRAMGLPADVAAAAYLPALSDVASRTLIRLDGFGPSVRARVALLGEAFAAIGAAERIEGDAARETWRALHGSSIAADAPLWRISVSARRALAMTQALEALGGRWIADWAGGLIWLALDGHAQEVRRLAEQAGGHAMLMRAPAAMRAAVPSLHPEQRGVAALAQRVRKAFDPSGIFETGRFPDHSDAN